MKSVYTASSDCNPNILKPRWEFTDIKDVPSKLSEKIFAEKTEGTLFSVTKTPDFGPVSKAVEFFRYLRKGMKCRPCDLGRYAGGITVDREYYLSPDGKISSGILPREFIHTSIMLYDTIDEATSAVERAWGEYGASLPRDIAHDMNNAPVGVVFKLEKPRGEHFFLLKSIMIFREHEFSAFCTENSIKSSLMEGHCDTEIPF